jgi:hypothetical protein
MGDENGRLIDDTRDPSDVYDDEVSQGDLIEDGEEQGLRRHLSLRRDRFDQCSLLRSLDSHQLSDARERHHEVVRTQRYTGAG